MVVMPSSPSPISRTTAPHYTWGEGCDGWELVRTPGLAVIEESVPPGAGEVRHRHDAARQFFYVLDGRATIETDDGAVALAAGEGFEVAPGTVHRFVNNSHRAVRFLVISAPTSRGDRVDLEDAASDAEWERLVAEAWAVDVDDTIVARMTALAAAAPHPALGYFELAGAYDSVGDEAAAVTEYERALASGLGLVDPARAAQLAIQYASTLRNLGRVDEAIAVLRNAPFHPATGLAREVFLSLALHDAGRGGEALQILIDAITPSLPRYQRSVRAYSHGLTSE